MITSAPDGGVTSLGLSPIGRSPKHEMTPLKTRRKTSRKDQATDVHTTCSTPNRFQSVRPRVAFNSPSDSFPCSQDHRPDVIWDYTSPKLPKGSSKRDIKMTVEEFLKNLSHNQAPECNTQNSQYIKLLEQWMAKQNTPVCVRKPARTMKRDHRMRSRRVYENIKQFKVSIERKHEEKAVENDGKKLTEKSSLEKSENSNNSSTLDKKPFLEGNSKQNDSIDELWGETDNSFIVKATQNLDVSRFKNEAENKNLEIVSTIPETAAEEANNNPKNSNSVAEQSTNNFLNKAILDSDYQAQMLLTQIMSYDWDSDSEIEDLENGFIMGDEDLSLIPDEVLRGADNNCNEKLEQQPSVAQTCDNKTLDGNLKLRNSKDQGCTSRSPEITFGCSKSNTINCQMANISEVELFNNFEDDGFDDELLLSKPEVLSWIDEVESRSSQSLKCTPEEIEKKKDEAIQRRKKNLSKRKS